MAVRRPVKVLRGRFLFLADQKQKTHKVWEREVGFGAEAETSAP